MTFRQQSIAQMRSQKTSGAGYDGNGFFSAIARLSNDLSADIQQEFAEGKINLLQSARFREA